MILDGLSVWLIIILVLGVIVSNLMLIKHTAHMKMHLPEELKNQFRQPRTNSKPSASDVTSDTEVKSTKGASEQPLSDK